MARTALTYPKIPGSDQAPLANCVAFEKYDGTNLHWMWDPDLGWHAFGTRRDRFDLDQAGVADFSIAHPELAEAPGLFLDAWRTPLTEVLSNQGFFGASSIVAFTEFLGDSSFAGRHAAQESKRLVMFDVQADGVLLGPDQFVRVFQSLPIARVVFRGRLTGKFAEDVREGRFDVSEGVICKGGETGAVWMVKIKTNAYLSRLKAAFASNWDAYWE